MTDYRITFRPRSSAIPPIIRLRRLLKLALRYMSLAAVSVEEIPRPADKKARAGISEIAEDDRGQNHE